MGDSKRKRRKSIPASQTAEGKERERQYYEALGRFTHAFAQMESAVALSLWHYAKMPNGRARAVFSGVRAKDAFSYIKRLAEVSKTSKEAKEDLEYVIAQFGDINSTRNDLIHYGAINIAEGTASVTNALKALSEDHVTAFPISPNVLGAMTADIRKIIVHLRVRHAGAKGAKSEKNWLGVVALLLRPWRYTRDIEHPLKSRKQGKMDGKEGKARKGQPPPLRGK